MRHFPHVQNFALLSLESLALPPPVILTKLQLLEPRVRICQFMLDEFLFVHPVVVVQDLLALGFINLCCLALDPEDTADFAVDEGLGLTCEILEIDANSSTFHHVIHRASVFLLLLTIFLKLVEFGGQLLQEGSSELTDLNPVWVAVLFFHTIILYKVIEHYK